MLQETPAAANPLGVQPIGRLLTKFAVPSIVSFLVSALYNIVDQIFIGQGVGTIGNAATNVAFPLTTISVATALLFGIGTAANFNLSLGAGDRERATRILGTGLSCLVLFGLALGAVHGVAEAVVVVFFWFGGLYQDAGYSFMTLIWGLVCGGTIVHSMVDYYLAMLIWAPVHRAVRIQSMWPAGKKQPV